MTTYEIEPIDPNVAYIVTMDDEPIKTATTGEPFRFVRRIDAERWVIERTRLDEAYAEGERQRRVERQTLRNEGRPKRGQAT